MPDSGLSKKMVTVGRVRDAHGLKGELFVLLFAGEAHWLKKMRTARLVSPQGEASYLTVKSARFHTTQGRKGIILSTQEIGDRTAAEAFNGYHLEISDEFLVSPAGDEPFLYELLNMKVNLLGMSETGTIVDFSSNGAQDLLVIRMPSGDFEVPFVDAFVRDIDYQTEEMTLDLPQGLIG